MGVKPAFELVMSPRPGRKGNKKKRKKKLECFQRHAADDANPSFVHENTSVHVREKSLLTIMKYSVVKGRKNLEII